MNKTLLLTAAAVTLGLNGLAADHYIKITGATAFRAFAYTAIASTFDAPPTIVGSSSSSLQSFKGKIAAKFGADDVYVFCSYSGSIQGLKDLLAGTQLSYAAVAGTTPPVGQRAADVSFMDNEPANNPVTLNLTPLAGNGDVLGVVPFLWIKNPHADAATIDNISQQTGSAIYGQGFLPLEQVTGLNADVGKYLVVCGRATSSGTRVINLKEVQRQSNDAVQQYALSGTSWLNADSLVNGSTIKNDDGLGAGYEKGGDLKTAIKLAGTDYPAVAMMSVIEAADATSTDITGSRIKYNGVDYSRDTMLNGTYTYWSYERMVWKSGANTSSTDLGKWYVVFGSKLQAELDTESGLAFPRAYSLSAMGTVGRGTDGSAVTK